jgi:hypothetical protein
MTKEPLADPYILAQMRAGTGNLDESGGRRGDTTR